MSSHLEVRPEDRARLFDYLLEFHDNLFTSTELRAARRLQWRMKRPHDDLTSATADSLQLRGADVDALLSEGDETFRARVCERVLREHASELTLNLCPRCGRLANTPRARQCFLCGHDWH